MTYTEPLNGFSYEEPENIEVFGARVHNLKNIDVSIPRNKLVVITGISGSGKSSLAFDTIYAEGQRRYLESFSAYARQFIGSMERPDVDKITGLSPVISIEQKSTNRNPRSTVGTVTEVYDFIRLLYARASEAYSYVTGKKMQKYTEEQILESIFTNYQGKMIYLLAPLVRGRKGNYRELFEYILKLGYLKVRVDGKITEVKKGMQLDRYKVHDIEVVVDRLIVEDDAKPRLKQSLLQTLKIGKGMVMIYDEKTQQIGSYSRFLVCPDSGISYDEPSPNSFSFNSPYGACPVCSGFGRTYEVSVDKIIPNKELSINDGGLAPLGQRDNSYFFQELEEIARRLKFKLSTPIKELPQSVLNFILYGSVGAHQKPNEDFSDDNEDDSDYYRWFYSLQHIGIAGVIKRTYMHSTSESRRTWAASFMNEEVCPECKGFRLKKESLHFKIADKHIGELAMMDIATLAKWFNDLEKHLTERQQVIARELLKEIRARLGFILEVGLDYLTLDRPAKSLSGGESQRIRLATQVGAELTGITYILDEPSIGLHQRDNRQLIRALRRLSANNSVLVVEHDRDIMLESDYIIDIGPAAGEHGGKVVAQGAPEQFKLEHTITAQYLNNSRTIPIPEQRRSGNGKYLLLVGARGNNLKNISVKFPLGTFICVTGVSGSGKSSLITETLYPILSNACFHNSQMVPLPYERIEGLEHIDKVIEIDQSPIGRTPRSNPATYIKLFDEIRKLYAQLPESKIRGYQPGRFSFNVKGGRCEACQGGGVKVIEMNFLPDVEVTCEKCNGRRYNRETLEVRYKGKSISDVLNMTVEDALQFFEAVPAIYNRIKTLSDVGLNYLRLGQSSTTLSGGEAQRVKLAAELSKRDTGKTFYILDEPTTGLHFEDIKVLLELLQRLVDKGNTVLVIEHNMDVIKVADYIIDIGPEGGERGGTVVACGTPEEVAKANSHTASFLKEELVFSSVSLQRPV
ncbi:MAG: excinuclease ABC subunit UvrA [Chitinophagales bacterium]|nr:excinuclease ABC subunit UvrA [Chitinophagales bacterium]MDW8274072.1 excinuclease ABC subunit UvrA [Chitinophagales bacterium]